MATDPASPSPLARAFQGPRKAFVPFVMAGDPDLETSARVVRALDDAGASVIELGVPFSDPIADGPVNQRAAERALAQGTTIHKVLDLVRDLRRDGLRAPVVLFSYLNPLLALGRAPDPADATLVLDPADDDEVSLLAGHERIPLAAPTTSDDRLASLAATSGSFVYYVSRYGVTGARADLPPTLAADVARVRRLTGKPVAVGFGVSTPALAAAVARVADGVVIGSAIVERVERAGVGAPEVVAAFAREVVAAIAASPTS